MTARPQDVALLPLPMFDHHLPVGDGGPDTPMWSANKMRVYALEVATAALASAQAREEELREEVAEWKRVAAAQAELHDEAEARAERLEEALRSIRDVAREPYGVLSRAWVSSTADAALSANAATQTGETT